MLICAITVGKDIIHGREVEENGPAYYRNKIPNKKSAFLIIRD
jgi:hypothetical protein